MKHNYVCLECETEVDELEKYEERHGVDTLPFEECHVCPSCGSMYVLPAVYCDLCQRAILDEYIITINDQNICENCYTKRHIDDL